MAYYSPYQPNVDQSGVKKFAYNAGKSVLEKSIIYGAQLTKFVILFVIDAIKRVLGR